MKFYDKINDTKNIFISSINEPGDNTLEFILTLGKVEESEKSVVLDGINLGMAREIYSDDSCESFSVRFETYISYSVIDESYDNQFSGKFRGNKIRIYLESNFLEYIKADTLAEAKDPDNYKHFCFISLNHIVNVVSVEEPIITKIE